MSQFILRHTAPQVERTMQKRAADAGFGPWVGHPISQWVQGVSVR